MTLKSQLFIILKSNSNYKSLDALLAFFDVIGSYNTIFAG